jgi:hypothetical protein
MRVVRAHGVGVDGVQLPAPRFYKNITKKINMPEEFGKIIPFPTPKKEMTQFTIRTDEELQPFWEHPLIKKWKEEGIIKVSEGEILPGSDKPLKEVFVDNRYIAELDEILGEIQKAERDKKKQIS